LFNLNLLRYGDYEWTVTEPAQSWTLPHSQRRQHDQQMLFAPSTTRVDVERKLNADERPRFVEEEGLYVGEMPWVPEKVKNKLENRLELRTIDCIIGGEPRNGTGLALTHS
jgi:hypothetical protein